MTRAMANDINDGLRTQRAAPIVKWAGGKTKLLPELLARMPEHFGRYYEPFAGGAALFFGLAPESAVLGDSSVALVSMYSLVARRPDAVIALIKKHAANHRRSGVRHYLAVRDRWNALAGTQLERAAMLLYLNRTCFNGLWRVNRVGDFNVPMGAYSDPLAALPDKIRAAAPSLARAGLRAGDYRATLHDVARGDFVYFDPPYDGTFGGYTAEPFEANDQAALAAEVRRLADRGVRVMLSNADTPRIRVLYDGLSIDKVRCPRAINSDGTKRGEVDEVIVTAGYDSEHNTSRRARRRSSASCLPDARKDPTMATATTPNAAPPPAHKDAEILTGDIIRRGIKRTLPCKLTDAEFMSIAKTRVDKEALLEQMEADFAKLKKSHLDSVADHEDAIDTMRRELRTGEQERTIDCAEVFRRASDGTGWVYTLRMDWLRATYASAIADGKDAAEARDFAEEQALVERRPATPTETQRHLPGVEGHPVAVVHRDIKPANADDGVPAELVEDADDPEDDGINELTPAQIAAKEAAAARKARREKKAADGKDRTK